MSSEFLLAAGSGVVPCQASVYFNKRNNGHEDSFIGWEFRYDGRTAFCGEITGMLKVPSPPS